MVDQAPVSASSSAIGPAAGYYFQLRFGLYRALEAFQKEPTGVLSIETFDDVSLEQGGKKIDGQLKHSINKNEKISKFSPAIWRTLAIWLDRLQAGLTIHHEFHFITTSSMSDDNPLKKLLPDPDELAINSVIAELETIAATSTNKKTKSDRDKFLGCSAGTRLSLVRRIRVVSNTPDITSISTDIEAILRYACEPPQAKLFREDLEGWWVSRVLDSWIDDCGASVELEEIGAHVSYLKERYKPSSLPLDVPEQDCGDIMEERPFVRQIRLVTDSEQRLRNAQKAYLRSKTQRSKWVREHRIDPAELDDFDVLLKDRWEAQHVASVDEMLEPDSSTDQMAVGKNLLKWAETSEFPIRSTKSVYLTSGSYHALSDTLTVGWHPKFKDKLTGDL